MKIKIDSLDYTNDGFFVSGIEFEGSNDELCTAASRVQDIIREMGYDPQSDYSNIKCAESDYSNIKCAEQDEPEDGSAWKCEDEDCEEDSDEDCGEGRKCGRCEGCEEDEEFSSSELALAADVLNRVAAVMAKNK